MPKSLYPHFDLFLYLRVAQILATSELRKRPGNSDVDNASRDCFWALRPLKQSLNLDSYYHPSNKTPARR